MDQYSPSLDPHDDFSRDSQLWAASGVSLPFLQKEARSGWSIFPLMSELSLASSRSSDFIQYKNIDSHGIKLGEGTTYIVEKRRAPGTLFDPADSRHWVAVKRAKLKAPNALSESVPDSNIVKKALRSILLEIAVSQHLVHHPYIVSLLGYVWPDKSIGLPPLLVMELAPHGCLNDFLLHESLSMSELKAICSDIVSGLMALHDAFIVHGDMKQENVLVFPSKKRRFKVKITDFENALIENCSPWYGGTPIYNAPEIQSHRHVEESGHNLTQTEIQRFILSDVFSFGLLAFEVFCHGKRYYDCPATKSFRDALIGNSLNEMNTMAMAMTFITATDWLPNDLQDTCCKIFCQTLEYNPSRRLPKGWIAIIELLGNEMSSASVITVNNTYFRSGVKPVSYYSIIALYDDEVASPYSYGRRIWNDLSFMTNNSQTREDRGKAFYELFLMYTLGSHSPPLEKQEPLDWLVASASYGYEGAFITGNQIFAAHGLPTPEVILDGPKCKLLRKELHMLIGLASHEFYSNAVRIFLTKEQRARAPDLTEIREKFDFDESFYGQTARTVGSRAEPTTDWLKTHSLLFKAVLQEDKQAMTYLIQGGYNTNIRTADGLTPLHLACRIASIPLIRLLLKCGADASLNDAYGVSPIHWIILLPEREISQIAELLIENGADLMTCNSKPFYFDTLGLRLIDTPLNWACTCRNAIAVKSLLGLGAEVEHFRGKGETKTLLGLLCADILDILITDKNVFHHLSPDQEELVWNCIGVPFSDFQHWCIHGASYEMAYTEIIDSVIQAGIPFPILPSSTIHATNIQSPLVNAAQNFNPILLRKYLEMGAKIDDRDWHNGATALDSVIEECAAKPVNLEKILETIRTLIDNRASLESESQVPSHRILKGPRMGLLHNACFSIDVPVHVIEMLAKRVCSSINQKFQGCTPLYLSVHMSVRDEKYEIVRVLLDHGANPDIETDHVSLEHDCCRTAIAEALRPGSWKTAKMMLDRGCSTDIGVLGGHRQTLSHLIIILAYKIQRRHHESADREMESLFEIFLTHPIVQSRNLVNDVDYQGYSPIALAVFLGVPHCAKVLAEHRCNLDLPEGKNIFHLLDHCLNHPPTFVVENKYMENKELRNTSFPLVSHSTYTNALIKIQKIFAYEKPSLSIPPFKLSHSIFPLSSGPPHLLRYEPLPILCLGQPSESRIKYLEIETELFRRFGVSFPTVSADAFREQYDYVFSIL